MRSLNRIEGRAVEPKKKENDLTTGQFAVIIAALVLVLAMICGTILALPGSFGARGDRGGYTCREIHLEK